MSKPKIYVHDRIYIPASAIDKEAVKDNYTIHSYKSEVCRTCDYLNDRPSSVCESGCGAYLGVTKLWAPKEIGGKPYIGVPVGDKSKVEQVAAIDFDDFEILDKRRKVPFKYNIKFILKLRDHQTKLAATFLKKKYGLIEAPPRTGKTALMLHLAVELGQRTVLLANQHEFLQQFLWHIEGNEAEGIPKCTNLPELEKKYGKKLYGFPKTAEDFENFQFFAMTYQQFVSKSKGDERFRRLMKHVGTVMIDEVHRTGAAEFSKVVNKFYTRYRFGVTGTVERKDKKHIVYKKILGPVVARTSVEAMTPKVFIKETGLKLRRVPKQWTYMMQALAKSDARNTLLAKRAVKDVEAGHSVVIPLTFVKHIHEVVRLINQEAGKPIAKAFIGGSSVKHKAVRQQILADAKAGTVKVIVGTRSLLQLGINVPRWSCIYTAIPISNPPNYKQETSRIRTPMEGKRQPIVRLFYDSVMGASVGCAKNCVQQMKGWKYEFSKDEHTQAAVAYFSTKSNRRGYVEEEDTKPQRMLDFDEGERSSFMSNFKRAGRK